MNLTPPSQDNSFNNAVEIQPDPVPMQCSTPDHAVSAQNQESPPASPPPSPHRAELEKLKARLKRQTNKNKMLMKKLIEEKRKATKYRKQTQRKKRQNKEQRVSEKNHLPPSKRLRKDKKHQVESFLLLDEHSILLPGKKDVVGRKEKKQRRVLTSSLKDLHKSYIQKCDREYRMSYRQFLRYRPFYITEAKSSDRNTCACYQHENMRLLIDSVTKRGLISTKSLSTLLSSIVCNTEEERCMHRQCPECCFDEVQLGDHSPTDTATWEQWEKEDVLVGEKTYKNWVKKSKRGTLGELHDLFQRGLEEIASHQFNWLHQVQQFRHIKENLKNNEMVLHIDFSENYACKLYTEIQSFHFGGNRQQATIHTGVAYSVSGSQCYATISESLRHDERAVWAHIKPVIEDFRKSQDHVIDTLHVLSDGPATQYRNRANCFLMSSIPFTWGFKQLTWNFSERSHGKGAPDGVGGVLKRKADMHVRGGNDVQTPMDLYDYLQKSSDNVTVKWVTEEDISAMDEMLPPSVRPVTGIRSTHQVLSSAPGQVFYRALSCFCKHPEVCRCHKLKKLEFEVHPSQTEATHAQSTDCDASSETCAQSSYSSPGEPQAQSEDPSSVQADLQTSSDEEELTDGQFVIVKYDGKPYVGQIKGVNDEVGMQVNCMKQRGNKNAFVWPNTADCIFYHRSQIVCGISAPKQFRRFFTLNKYDWLMYNEV